MLIFVQDIKAVMKMNMLDAKSPDILAKELILGFVAYNLVRHLMSAIAKQLNVSPRDLSFTSILRRVRAIHNLKTNNTNPFHYLLQNAKALKLPKRKKRQAEPRKIWSKGQNAYITTSREEEREKINKDKLLP